MGFAKILRWHPAQRTSQFNPVHSWVRAVHVAQSLSVSGSDHNTFAEAMVRLFVGARTATDAPTFAEVISQTRFFQRSGTDAPTFAEVMSRTIEPSRVTTESLTFAENMARLFAGFRNQTDHITFSEIMSENGQSYRTTSDALAFSIFAYTDNQLFRTGFPNDAIVFNEYVDAVGNHQVAASDHITFVENCSIDQTLFRTVTDNPSFYEVATWKKTKYRTTPDYLTFADVATRSEVNYRTGDDSITFYDVAGQTRPAYATDSLIFNEVATRTKGPTRTTSDHVLFAEIARIRQQSQRSATDAPTFAEVPSRHAVLHRTGGGGSYVPTPLGSPMHGLVGTDGNTWWAVAGTVFGGGTATGASVWQIRPDNTPIQYPLLYVTSNIFDIAQDLLGNFWVTDKTGVVWQVIPGFSTTRVSGVGWTQPYGVTVTPDGIIWVSDPPRNLIYRLNTLGSIVSTISFTASHGPGEMVQLGGYVYATDLGSGKFLWREPNTGVGSPVQYSFPITTGPRGICVGPDSNLWMADALNNAVWKLTMSGGAVTAFTEYLIPGATQVNGICIGIDGRLWVTDAASGTVYGVTTAGVVSVAQTIPPRGATAPKLQFPLLGPDSKMWFSDSSLASSTFGGPVSFPADTAGFTNGQGVLAPDGNIWMSNGFDGEVWKVQPDGTTTPYFVGTAAGNAICVDSDGYLWTGSNPTQVVGAGKLIRIALDGTATTYSGLAFQSVSSIATGADGNLYIGDNIAHKIYKYSTAPALLATFTLNNAPYQPQPLGLVLGPDGNIWASDFSINVLWKITPGGVLTKITMTGFPASGTQGICTDGTNLWAAGTDTVYKCTTAGVSTHYAIAGQTQVRAIAYNPADGFFYEGDNGPFSPGPAPNSAYWKFTAANPAGAVKTTILSSVFLDCPVIGSSKVWLTAKNSIWRLDNTSTSPSAGAVWHADPNNISFSDAATRVKVKTRTTTDHLIFAEAITRKLRLVQSDSLTFADAVTRTVNLPARTGADHLTFAMTSTRVRNQNRNAADNLTFLEAITRKLALIQTDNLTFADTATRQLNGVLRAIDHVLFSEVITTTRNYVRQDSDTLTFADSAHRITTQPRTAVDMLNLAEAATQLTAAVRVSTDHVTFTDSPVRIMSGSRQTTDHLTFLDTATRRLQGRRSAADSLTFADTVAYQQALRRSSTDIVHFNEALIRVINRHRFATDSITFSEFAKRRLGVTRTSVDTVTFSDAAVAAALMPRTGTEHLTFTEVLARLTQLGRDVVGNVTFVDTAAEHQVIQRPVTDAILISEQLTVQQTLLRTLTDAVHLADTATRTQVVARVTTDFVTFADVANVTANIGLSATDSLTFNDVVTRSVVASRNIADSLTFAEVATRTSTVARSVTDFILFADVATDTKTSSVTDSLTFSDTAARTIGYVRAAFDLLTFSDVAFAQTMPHHVIGIIGTLDTSRIDVHGQYGHQLAGTVKTYIGIIGTLDTSRITETGTPSANISLTGH